jgi:hypothetical protein
MHLLDRFILSDAVDSLVHDMAPRADAVNVLGEFAISLLVRPLEIEAHG